MKLFSLKIVLLTLLVSSSLFSQEKKIEKANKSFEKYEFIEAIKIYEEVAEDGYKSVELFTQLGDSYYNLADLKNAEKWYEALIALNEEINAEYYYKYAQVLKTLKRYDEADEMIAKFELLRPLDKRSELFKSNEDYLITIAEQSGRFEIKKLKINSEYSDFGPSFYKDEVIFSSARDTGLVVKNINKWNDKTFLDLYSSKMSKNGNLNKVSKFSSTINTKFHESTSAFTSDGKTVYFTRNDYIGGKRKRDKDKTTRLKVLKATINENGHWENIVELPFNSDEYSVAHPALSVDETKLYFSSDMPGTYGLSDIYVVDINKDGTFGEPQNLGIAINTEGRETFPFISKNNDLYFSSDARPGLGGLDVFVAKLESPTEIGLIYNIGEPINSPFDDFSFIINSDTKIGYFSSNREGGQGSDDIYLLTQTKPIQIACDGSISGVIVDHSKRPITNVLVTLFDSSKNEISKVTTTVDGSFNFEVPCKDEKYKLVASKEGFFGDEKLSVLDFNNPNNKEELILVKETYDVGTDLMKVLNLNMLYFDLNKAEIRPDAAIELDKVVKYLKEYASVHIEIRSHTDSRGSDKYNLELSDRRAKSTAAYIISKGIKAERITGRGYGETMLLNRCNAFTRCDEEDHQVNRRSEFIIVAN